MNSTNTDAAYSRPTIWLHWIMLVLIAATCALMELKSLAPRGSVARTNMALFHYFLGLSVLVLAWPRLLARSLGTAPLIEPAPPAWQAALAKLIHVLLYVLIIGLPILGWLALSAKGKPVHLFFFDLPLPIAQDEPFAKQLKFLHETGATVAYVLIGLHAAAALFHHYKMRDNTLRRMLPARFRG